jgi:hypothetical protein
MRRDERVTGRTADHRIAFAPQSSTVRAAVRCTNLLEFHHDAADVAAGGLYGTNPTEVAGRIGATLGSRGAQSLLHSPIRPRQPPHSRFSHRALESSTTS